MKRTRALALAALLLLGLGFAARQLWPSAEPALPCAPEHVRVVEGVAMCGPGQEPSLGQARALGLKLDLNRATEPELARLVGGSLARRIVEERRALGGFTSWDQVDAIPGVGGARLEALQEATALQPEAAR